MYRMFFKSLVRTIYQPILGRNFLMILGFKTLGLSIYDWDLIWCAPTYLFTETLELYKS